VKYFRSFFSEKVCAVLSLVLNVQVFGCKMAFFTYFVITVLIAFVYHTKYNRRNGILHKIPALSSYYLIGCNLSFLGKSAAQILKTLEMGFASLGSVIRFDFSPFTTTVMIADPTAAGALLSSEALIDKSYEFGFIKNWLTDGCSKQMLLWFHLSDAKTSCRTFDIERSKVAPATQSYHADVSRFQDFRAFC
jgi:hypothetical protein